MTAEAFSFTKPLKPEMWHLKPRESKALLWF